MNPLVSSINVMNMVEGNIYGLKANEINVFDFEKGNIVFPVPESLAILQIVFLEPGLFRLVAPTGITFSLGCNNFTDLEVQPGEPTFDCCPCFMYYPKRKQWVIMSQGSFITFDRENDTKEEKKSWLPFFK